MIYCFLNALKVNFMVELLGKNYEMGKSNKAPQGNRNDWGYIERSTMERVKGECEW